MIQPKYVSGMAVQILSERDGKPAWLGGYTYVRTVDDTYIRVRQELPGGGHRHTTTWTHDRVRPDVRAIRIDG